MFEDSAGISQSTLDAIAKNLADIGAISLDDYLDPHSAAPPRAPSPALAPATEPVGVNATTRLHQACQRAFRSTDPLKFEFIEQADSRNKQCILTIIKPDGVRRSYATQPAFAKKNEAKLEAARIAIEMGALDFLAGGGGEGRPERDLARASLETSGADNAATSDSLSVQPKTAPETCMEDIEKCCLEWRAGRVIPHWVPFFDAKSMHKQGCALRIQLSQHVVRVYLSDPIFATYLDAKEACAKAAVSEGVLDFIRHGNGQTCPSPTPLASSTSQSPPLTTTTPWTLQAFYDTLPRPFPESFDTNDASGINAPGWLNTMVQNARGGKLILSFFFTSDGPPGLHGCLLKLDRPGEYKASLVDARFPKRSDAKAAVCLQAMSEGIGDYIRSIASALDTKITPAMRSFSSSLVYPALTSELSKINTDLVPLFEYDKERDAFGATLIIRLSTVPAPGQVRRYTVPIDYRIKADAKVAAICHAAEQGAVEFVRFRGGAPPDRYQSPYVLHAYDPDASRKRKQPGSAEDAEEGQSAKKRARTKRTKRRERRQAHGDGSHLTPVMQHLAAHPGGDQIHGISGLGDTDLSYSVSADGLGDPSQPGVGSAGGSGVGRPLGASYSGQIYAASYPAVLDPRFVGVGGLGERGCGVHPVPGAYGSAPRVVDVAPPESGPSRAMPGSSSRTVRRRVEHAELEPGEVVSSAESEFSESSSRNEGDVCTNEREVDSMENKEQNGTGAESIDDVENVAITGRSKEKGKGREVSPANRSTMVPRDDPGATATATAPHVKKLIEYCATHGCGMPSFHETQRKGRFQVWIVIGKERFDLPTTYGSAEEGRQRVAKQVLARMCKGSSG